MDAQVLQYPLDKVDILIVNETEAAGLSGEQKAEDMLSALSDKYPKCEIVLTLGSKGVQAVSEGKTFSVPAENVEAVDTTAAGDTFIGYYLGERVKEKSIEDSLKLACRAAAISVTRPGAADSIPTPDEL